MDLIAFKYMLSRIFCFIFIYKIIIYAALVIASLNVNGLVSKQNQVIEFMRYNKISILLLQEHNIRDINKVSSKWYGQSRL